MKKAEEYVEEIGDGLYMAYGVRDRDNKFTPVMSIKNAEAAIRKAQEDAIRETVERCAESAVIILSDKKGNTRTTLSYEAYGTTANVSKESILNICNNLIKEL